MEALALVEVLGAPVLGVHLEIDGATTRVLRHREGLPERREPHPSTTALRHDEQLVEPRRAPAVLQGPRVSQHGDADWLRIVRE